jgi:hypothetical protein
MIVKLIEGVDYYFNEKGLMVLTAHYLRNRGYCCGNGCRHCPYPKEAYDDARRKKQRNQLLGF